MEANGALKGAVGLDFGPAVALGFVHFVVAGPVELDGVGGSAAEDLAGDAAESEFAGAVRLEDEVGRLDQLGIVLDIVRHLDDAPTAEEAHAGVASSLGSRTRL